MSYLYVYIYLTLTIAPGDRYLHYAHFIEGERKPQRGRLSWPSESHGQETDFRPELLSSGSLEDCGFP